MASPRQQKQPHPPKHRMYAIETIGLFLIAVMLLVLTLIRYWQNRSWSAH